ncbi:MAG: methanethiol S-methyltransferase [Steroidobacteraceae bacterium]|jgi:protein-S-isoprenylcysteine O-methyltransferase Ste14
MGIVAAVYGLFCYAVFLASFLYAIGFIGDLVVPKTIDSIPSSNMPEALAVNLVLLGLFAVQHSVMARQGFKAVWTRIVPRALERSTYVLISSLLLGLICWKWQAIPTVVWNISSPVFKTLLLALFALGWLILLLSTFMINHFDLFGLRQVYLRLRGLDYTPLSFTERALYKFVRHPIYLGFVIAFWATPHMSVGHLIFSIATTGYIFIGIFLEERDLMKYHGVDYGAYRARVPMLLPTGAKRG